ncbi:hypothetical protein BCU68_14010 [Vibrio sp. 10N.286.49.B3]|uniref:autotransporter assembly complex protein TamA n=1 Tax=Vibrio sp. 10N.286.49.B3 TaxID=1880855 RepID=UPI000C8164B6|nr:autotransporter assembly complex family protein [Vibrio sp. 10N.286.49.B3]PMH42549.1 hypothetical protein BCU68_14010 [Vibrio sp. 10N.286.49.B3]
MIRKTLLILLSFLLAPIALAANVSLKINGIDGQLKDNVDAYLSSIDDDDYSTSLRFQSRLETTITEALQALGYYHADIQFSVSDDKRRLTVNVESGAPVVIYELDIIIRGEAEKDIDFLNLIATTPLRVGAELNHSYYDALKSGLRNIALQKGYFEGNYTMSRLEVSPDLNRAYVRLHYDSGIRYQFGETTIVGSQIEDVRVRSLQSYEEGDAYLLADVGAYNQALSNTDWFSSVFVSPDLTQLGKGRELPMTVSLAPQAKNQIETGLGYSTDIGVKGTLKWNKPWVNKYGHSFDSSLSLSMPEQTITAGYQIPLEDVENDFYRIQYGMKNVDNRDTQSLESNLALERHWRLDNGWHRTIYIRYLLESYEQGMQDDTGQFLLPGIGFSRTRTRGGVMASWGDKQSVSAEYGDDLVLSEARVLRLQGRTSWVRSLQQNHRGLFRLEGGANITKNLSALSPSLRFFAGGDSNLRGYSYESISPEDSSGSLTGAKYILTSTLEYQYRVVGNWWGAMFVDYGDAFNNTPEWKTGAGVGVRWASPIGPVSLDFAWGLDEEPGDQFHIHFRLGPDL